jgi:hypothetical protein
MSRTSIPNLRRNHSSSDGSCVDPYDKAEQGFQISLEDLSSARPPLEAKKTLSFRSSLRSSDTTLVGFPSHEEIVDEPRRPLPCQGKYQTILPTGLHANCIRTTALHNNLENKMLRWTAPFIISSINFGKTTRASSDGLPVRLQSVPIRVL